MNTNQYSVQQTTQVPNGTGFVLGAMQLVLYGIYRNGKPSKLNVSKGLEEGWQHEHLIISSPTPTPIDDQPQDQTAIS